MGMGRRQMCFLCISSVWIVSLESVQKLLSKQSKLINSRCSRCPCVSIRDTIFVNKFSWYTQLPAACACGCVSWDVWVLCMHLRMVIAGEALCGCVWIRVCSAESIKPELAPSPTFTRTHPHSLTLPRPIILRIQEQSYINQSYCFCCKYVSHKVSERVHSLQYLNWICGESHFYF